MRTALRTVPTNALPSWKARRLRSGCQDTGRRGEPRGEGWQVAAAVGCRGLLRLLLQRAGCRWLASSVSGLAASALHLPCSSGCPPGASEGPSKVAEGVSHDRDEERGTGSHEQQEADPGGGNRVIDMNTPELGRHSLRHLRRRWCCPIEAMYVYYVRK